MKNRIHDYFFPVKKEICGFISVHMLKPKHYTVESYSVEITNLNSVAER